MHNVLSGSWNEPIQVRALLTFICSSLAMPVSRAQKKSAAVKARLRRYRKAKQSDAGSDDDRPKSKTPATYKPSSSLYDEDTEDAEDYRPGGYHPLTVS